MARHIDITVTEASFDPEAALKAFRQRMAGAGAVVSFTGAVRQVSGEDPVLGLTLQHYPGFTESAIEGFATDAMTRWLLEGGRIIHRVGELRPGEPIVFVATASAHRRAAFEAADYLMDYLKSEAPFWKKERRADGEHWIEPRGGDYNSLARWQNEER